MCCSHSCAARRHHVIDQCNAPLRHSSHHFESAANILASLFKRQPALLARSVRAHQQAGINADAMRTRIQRPRSKSCNLMRLIEPSLPISRRMQRHGHNYCGQFPTEIAVRTCHQRPQHACKNALAAKLQRTNKLIYRKLVLKKEQVSY
jgi:hypothetical protein